jgi:prepilin-type N-terminal cleavage/methylation domain-containing protein
MRNKQKGFSLIELLIVVAIILIIAAIAIPNLLRARISANEASAVASLRTMNTASITYNSNYGNYPTALSNLGPSNGATPTSTTADLLDSVLAPAGGGNTATKSGYGFTYVSPGTNVGYTG